MKFPTAVLAYLEVALAGPLAPGGIAHRAKHYPITAINNGQRGRSYLTGVACQPATTRQAPALDTNGDPYDEDVPVTVCAQVSAAWAQAHGATRCTDPACWPIQAGEQPDPAPEA